MVEHKKGALIGQGRTAEVFEWGETQILKLYRKEMPVHWVEIEARNGRAVCEAGIAAPVVEGLVEVDGRPGIIYERVRGPSMLEVLSRKPWLLGKLSRQFAELHAQMHTARHGELPSQLEMLKGAIDRATSLSPQNKEKILEKLAQLPGGAAACHGDFHPINILMSERGPAVIDWMTVTQGNALFDVARTSYLLSQAAIPPGTNFLMKLLILTLRSLFHFFYLQHYRKLRPFSRQDLQEWRGVIAAARLSEEIAPEKARLLAIVENSLAPGKRGRLFWMR